MVADRDARKIDPPTHADDASSTGFDLSVVVPAYREARRIRGPLREMDRHLSAGPMRCELVVVDDGSDDSTCDIVRETARGLTTPLRLFRSASNCGKGHALKVGFEHARGARILFTDADLSTPIEECDRLVAALDAGHPIAIGSRKMDGARIEVHQPPLREALGRVFTALVRLLIADVSDATCGFKAFRADVGRDLFSRVRVFDWSFDAEVLRLARDRNIAIHEVPVRWQDREGSKVDLRRDVIKSLVGIGQVRLNALRGRYREALPAGPVEEIAIPGRLAGTPAEAGD